MVFCRAVYDAALLWYMEVVVAPVDTEAPRLEGVKGDESLCA